MTRPLSTSSGGSSSRPRRKHTGSQYLVSAQIYVWGAGALLSWFMEWPGTATCIVCLVVSLTAAWVLHDVNNVYQHAVRTTLLEWLEEQTKE